MGEEQKAVVLNGGRELEVGLVSGADEFLHALLGGTPARSGTTALRVVKNAAGRPFVAVLIGSKHVGFLSPDVTPDLLPALAACEEQGAVPQAKGLVTLPADAGGRPRVTVSLAQPDQVLPPQAVPAPATEPVAQAAEPALPADVDDTTAEEEEPVEEAAPIADLAPLADLGATAAMPAVAMAPVSAPAPAAVAAPEAEAAPEATPPDPDAPSTDEQQLLDQPEADQAAEYCPNCGSPHPPGATWCGCGYSLYGVLTVAGNKLTGTSPMALPEICVKCAAEAADGRRTRKKLYYYPMWIWATIVVAGMVPLILYFLLRKPVDVSYSLCQQCASRRRAKMGIAISAWVLFLAAVALTVVTSGSMVAVVALVVLFVLALVATVLVSAPLRVSGYDERYFSVAGACPEFRARVSETVH